MREHLTFQAQLRMGNDYDKDEKKKRVNELLEKVLDYLKEKK